MRIPSLTGQIQQFIVRNALPEEEREARGQLQIAQPVDRCLRFVLYLLDAYEKLWRRQQRFERMIGLASAFEMSLPSLLKLHNQDPFACFPRPGSRLE